MRALLLVLALAVPVGAQTCGGVLSIPLRRVHTHTYTGTRVDTLVAASAARYDVTALAIEADAFPAPPDLRARPTPEALRAADPHLAVTIDSLGDPHDGRLFWPRDDLRTWTRCGFALLRYTLTIRTGEDPPPVMVLDLYHVPAHVPIEAEEPLTVRPGRWSFDFADGLPLRDENLRPEPE